MVLLSLGTLSLAQLLLKLFICFLSVLDSFRALASRTPSGFFPSTPALAHTNTHTNTPRKPENTATRRISHSRIQSQMSVRAVPILPLKPRLRLQHVHEHTPKTYRIAGCAELMRNFSADGMAWIRTVDHL